MILIARRPIARSHPAHDPPGTLQERTITDPTPLPAPAAETAFPPALFVPDSVPAGGALPGVALPEQVKEAIGRAIAASRSPNTRRSYQVAWRAWESWARGRGYQALPAPPGLRQTALRPALRQPPGPRAPAGCRAAVGDG